MLPWWDVWRSSKSVGRRLTLSGRTGTGSSDCYIKESRKEPKLWRAWRPEKKQLELFTREETLRRPEEAISPPASSESKTRS